MILRFCSGSVTPASAEKALLGVDADHLDPEVFGEGRHHLVPLAEAQQAVVDEDAGELVADGAVDQGGGHRGVDAAGKAEDDMVAADLLADAGDGVLDDLPRRPLTPCSRRSCGRRCRSAARRAGCG